MKVHTTNYENTFITVADDTPASSGQIPPLKANSKTVANIEFEILSKNPYKYTSDEVLFQVYSERKDLTKDELEEARKVFFSKGQPCMRASPLTKRYGWGIHYDGAGKMAIYSLGTDDYDKFSKDKDIKVVKAMKSGK